MDAPKQIKWHNGLAFPSLEEGRDALIQRTLDNNESFQVAKADHKRFFTYCSKGPECPYRIRLYVRRDTTEARVQLYKPQHTCSPDTHAGWVPPQLGPVKVKQPAPVQPESQKIQPEAVPTHNEELSPMVDHAVDAVVESTLQEKPKKSKKNKKNKDIPLEELPVQTTDDQADEGVELTLQEESKKSKKSNKSKKGKKAKQAAAERELPPYEMPGTQAERHNAAAEREIMDWANHVDEHAATTYEKGLQTRREVLGDAHVNRSLTANSNAFSRPMQEIVTEFAWGNIWNREGLSRQQRSLINIALLTALNRTLELGVHIRGAVNNGLSELEIREAIIHSTVYCGAPAGMEAARTAERVLSEMQANGEHERVLL